MIEDTVHDHRLDESQLLLNHNGLGYLHLFEPENPFVDESIERYAFGLAEDANLAAPTAEH